MALGVDSASATYALHTTVGALKLSIAILSNLIHLTKTYWLQLVLALLTLKHHRSNSGGLLPYQYFDKHTLFCVRYTNVHDFSYIIVSI